MNSLSQRIRDLAKIQSLELSNEVLEDYAKKDSSVDMGNLYFAAGEYKYAYEKLSQALADVCESLENLEGEICNHEDVLKDVGSWAPEKKRDFCSTCHQWVYRDWKNEATQALSKLEALVQALEGQKVKDGDEKI